MKNRSGEKIKLASIDELLGVVNEESAMEIRQIRGKVEKLVSSFGLDGSEIVADIASDYFEDYVNYKEPDIRMTNEEFLGIIQKVARE